MTVFVKHTRQNSGRQELIIKNGFNTAICSVQNDGRLGAIDLYKGKERLVGINMVGNKMDTTAYYDSKSLRTGLVEADGFENSKSGTRNKKYIYVQNELGVLNRPLLAVHSDPFDRISLCDGQGSPAIDLWVDSNGYITEIASSRYTAEKTLLDYKDEEQPAKNEQIDLKKSRYFFARRILGMGSMRSALKQLQQKQVQGLSRAAQTAVKRP